MEWLIPFLHAAFPSPSLGGLPPDREGERPRCLRWFGVIGLMVT